MPEKILASIGLIGMLAMTKPNSIENINWKAFGLLIAILIPSMVGIFSMGAFVGGLEDVPKELKAIHTEISSIKEEISDIKEDVAVLKVLEEGKR